ncbi:unnamed protein product, partial [Amoebophrya sp. A120]|eukprot:GSA120T00021681001.1
MMAFVSRPFEVAGAAFYADAFVAMHAASAFTFAMVAFVKPEMFSLFSKSNIPAESITADCIRWSAPFIFGFAFFAASSLYLDPKARLYIARVFILSFAIAVAAGVYAHTRGRWNDWHPLNIALFATLGLAYMVLVVGFPGALD